MMSKFAKNDTEKYDEKKDLQKCQSTPKYHSVLGGEGMTPYIRIGPPRGPGSLVCSCVGAGTPPFGNSILASFSYSNASNPANLISSSKNNRKHAKIDEFWLPKPHQNPFEIE